MDNVTGAGREAIETLNEYPDFTHQRNKRHAVFSRHCRFRWNWGCLHERRRPRAETDCAKWPCALGKRSDGKRAQIAIWPGSDELRRMTDQLQSRTRVHRQSCYGAEVKLSTTATAGGIYHSLTITNKAGRESFDLDEQNHFRARSGRCVDRERSRSRDFF